MKKTIISRLLHSQSPPFLKPHCYRDSSLFAARIGRFLSTGSEKVDGSSKLEEAEREEFTPPREKLLVLGGNGFVGSHICIEALAHGLNVSSLSRYYFLNRDQERTEGFRILPLLIQLLLIRSGKSSLHDPWANDIVWHQGDLLSPDSLGNALNGVTSVISCVGGFGSNSYMYDINGTANINAIRAASEQGVKRFVYISAADFGLVNYLLKGYFAGKRSTETELLDKFQHGGAILRPGFIHGTRRVGSVHLPLSIIGAPLEMVLRHAKPLTRLPLIGPLLIPPVNVTSVAKVAVRAAVDPAFPSGVVDVYGILQYSQQNPA
ncbi:hypothetical protein NC653_011199 [Populus alba x Populus x berolinensis]|uniref:NAD-dependent epimerase/dehydratase domain-containing protein n=1 Tax=Populus alba x Populus x berolinensis TaxID=444605 RepID=A0AAD6R1R1_9ROSI|nr:hypothetical protein NC653_011199 [Populus alba x Populus x berolinensis]